MDFRGSDSSIILVLRGWNPPVHRGFPGKFESSNLSRENVSREIGRTKICNTVALVVCSPEAGPRRVDDLGREARRMAGTVVPGRSLAAIRGRDFEG